MGLYQRVANSLPSQFSIFQMMALLSMEASDHREARNILKQWNKIGLVKRISQNMYALITGKKVEEAKAEKKAVKKESKKSTKKEESK